MKITEFQKKLKNIKNKGFIRSKRKGPTRRFGNRFKIT